MSQKSFTFFIATGVIEEVFLMLSFICNRLKLKQMVLYFMVIIDGWSTHLDTKYMSGSIFLFDVVCMGRNYIAKKSTNK